MHMHVYVCDERNHKQSSLISLSITLWLHCVAHACRLNQALVDQKLIGEQEVRRSIE